MPRICIHREPDFDYWGATSPEGVLYEAWRYRDGRADVWGVDCAPVAALPLNPTTNTLLAARYDEAMRMNYRTYAAS